MGNTASGTSDVAGIGMGSSTHQTTQSAVTPRVTAAAGAAPPASMATQIAIAAAGPMSSARVLIGIRVCRLSGTTPPAGCPRPCTGRNRVQRPKRPRRRKSGMRRHQAVIKATPVQQTAASAAATVAWGICVLTWSIRSQPVHTELSTVVSDMGEHWSP